MNLNDGIDYYELEANDFRKEKIEGVIFWRKDLSNIGKCQIGEGSVVHSHCWIGDEVKIGKNCRIEAFTFIPTGVVIEDNVFVGPGVRFTNERVPMSLQWDKTYVLTGACIGAGAIITPKITIGSNSLIGAGSVVVKNVPDNEVWVGNPAHFLRRK